MNILAEFIKFAILASLVSICFASPRPLSNEQQCNKKKFTKAMFLYPLLIESVLLLGICYLHSIGVELYPVWEAFIKFLIVSTFTGTMALMLLDVLYERNPSKWDMDKMTHSKEKMIYIAKRIGLFAGLFPLGLLICHSARAYEMLDSLIIGIIA